MKKMFYGIAASLILATSLGAVSFNQDSLKVSSEGYKTEDMVGVDGEFKDVKYKFSRNTSTLASYLKGARAVVNPSNVFMGEGNEIITDNLAKVFLPGLLRNSGIKVVFRDVVTGENKGVISARVTIDKKSTPVPLNYTIENNKFVAKGQLGLRTSKNSSQALRALSDVTPEHGGISRLLVDIVFSADVVQ